jgi:hypothetical protein
MLDQFLHVFWSDWLNEKRKAWPESITKHKVGDALSVSERSPVDKLGLMLTECGPSRIHAQVNGPSFAHAEQLVPQSHNHKTVGSKKNGVAATI